MDKKDITRRRAKQNAILDNLWWKLWNIGELTTRELCLYLFRRKK